MCIQTYRTGGLTELRRLLQKNFKKQLTPPPNYGILFRQSKLRCVPLGDATS